MMSNLFPLITVVLTIASIILSYTDKWRDLYDQYRKMTTPTKKPTKTLARGTKHTNRNQPQQSPEAHFAFESQIAETKTTETHTQQIRQRFTEVVTVLQQTAYEDRSLSVFDLDLLDRLTSLSVATIQTMRRSEIIINSEKLKRLYQNNPDLPQRALDAIRHYLQAVEAIQTEEAEVQHMGQKGELVVEAVRSAARQQHKKRKIRTQSEWRQAIITSEILSKPKSLKR